MMQSNIEYVIESDVISIYSNLSYRVTNYHIEQTRGIVRLPIGAQVETLRVVKLDNDTDLEFNNNSDQVEYDNIPIPYTVRLPDEPFQIKDNRIGPSVQVTYSKNGQTTQIVGYLCEQSKHSVTLIVPTQMERQSPVQSEGKSEGKLVKVFHIESIESVNPTNVKPEVELTINSPDDSKRIQVSYLLGNLSWSTHYDLIISTDNGGGQQRGQLIASAIINNSTNVEFNLTHLSLIAGPVHLPSLINTNTGSRALDSTNISMMAAASSQPITSTPIDEYVQYELPINLIVEGQSVIPLFNCENLESLRKIYQIDLDSDQVEYGYQWITDRYLPAGSLMVTFEGQFMGYTQLKESRPHSLVELKIGLTSQLKAKSHYTRVNLYTPVQSQQDQQSAHSTSNYTSPESVNAIQQGVQISGYTHIENYLNSLEMESLPVILKMYIGTSQIEEVKYNGHLLSPRDYLVEDNRIKLLTSVNLGSNRIDLEIKLQNASIN